MLLNCGVETPLDCKEIQPVKPKGNQSWIFTARTDTEAPILRPSDAKNWLTGKDTDTGKDWRQKEKRVTEDEMGGWHHCLSGHESEQTRGDSKGQGSLACCSPWGHRVRHEWATEQPPPQVLGTKCWWCLLKMHMLTSVLPLQWYLEPGFLRDN